MYDFAFILPLPSRVPVGGYKVVYEYSNRLVQRGYKVGVFFYPGPIKHVNGLVKPLASMLRHLAQSTVRPNWFDLDQRVDTRFLLQPAFINQSFKSRNYIATAWQTATMALQLSKRFGGKGLYLIQDYEEWSGSASEIDATFATGLKNIAISKWLQKLVIDKGNPCAYIPNGLDFEDFHITEDIVSRGNRKILGMYHKLPKKGSIDIIAAYISLRERYKNASFLMFSVYEKPVNLPDWIEYVHLPNKSELLEIYNASTVFVTASYYEGWGLPACEAMQCGCALVATDVPGHLEFAEDEKNSLLFKPGDVEALVSNVSRLLDDSVLRTRLAQSGSESIKRFSWQTSVDSLIYTSMEED